MRFRRTAVSGAVLVLAAAGVTAAILSAAPASAAIAGPALSVEFMADRHDISRDIYGMNFADEALANALRLPVRRWGGNATTRYNYALDETNRGSDWFFENVPGSADPAQLPNGSETDVFVDQDRRTGTRSILSVPLIGWVPKARDFTCGFSVSKYGAQQQTDQFRPDCGNGVRPDGSNVTGNDPHDTSVEADAAYVRAWLGHLTGKYGTAANGGVGFYNLDNEPDLWHATHRDVHPAGAGYDEMRDKTYAIGAAVKQADPSAKTLGPVGWGWLSMSLSGLDQETCNRLGGSCWSNPPDRAAHGGVPFADWYLGQMSAYEQANGVRILDYFDEHFYPQGSGVAFGNGNDSATNALRLRSTRALWDPSYVDESWINTPIALIPTMRSLVASRYPGTKTAVTEYNWGALDHINGALTQADVLGIFGREGLDLATLWSPPTATQPGAFAFRMYLNYDGLGGSFGNVGVRATSADQSKLAIYAADRTADGAKTFMVINKTGDDLTSTMSVGNGTSAVGTSAQVWRYSAANLSGITREADLPILQPPPVFPPGPSAIPATFPANSITLLVVPGAGTDTTPPSVSAPIAAAVTPTTLTASWGPGTDNVGITGYQIQLLPQGGSAVTVDVPAGTTSHQFTGLTPGAGYGLALRARDAAGNWSNFVAHPALIFLPTDVTPPTQPGPAVASNITSSGFTVTWAPSTDNVGVTQYSIFAIVQDAVYSVTSTQPTYTFTNLPANTDFSVTIGARDAAGNSSPRSTPVNVRTLSRNTGGCTATYKILSTWPGNFHGEVTVQNTGTTTLTGWTVRWTYPNGVTITQLWNGTVVSGPPSVAVRNVSWNGTLTPNQTATFGFLAAQSGSPAVPQVTCSSP